MVVSLLSLSVPVDVIDLGPRESEFTIGAALPSEETARRKAENMTQVKKDKRFIMLTSTPEASKKE
jgi:hypothetical protein